MAYKLTHTMVFAAKYWAEKGDMTYLENMVSASIVIAENKLFAMGYDFTEIPDIQKCNILDAMESCEYFDPDVYVSLGWIKRFGENVIENEPHEEVK